MPNYVTDNRALIEAVHRACNAHDITYKTFSDDWIIRMQKGDKTRFIFAYGFDCNHQAASDIASDKVATAQLLADAHLPVVMHYLVNTPVSDFDLGPIKELLQRGSIVVKPLHGSRGNRVAKFQNVKDALTFMKEPPAEIWACSPYVDIARELRLVIFDGAVRLVYEKLEPQQIAGLAMFNLNLGAQASFISTAVVPEDIVDLVVKAMHAIGLTLGAVDVAIDANGTAQVLEINSGFSLEHFAAMSADNREKVVAFYESVIETIFSTEM